MCDLDHKPIGQFGGIDVIVCEDVPLGWPNGTGRPAPAFYLQERK